MLRTDLSLAARCTVLCSNLEETVRVDLEGGDELGLPTRHGRNSVELEFSKQAVVPALRAFTLVAR